LDCGFVQPESTLLFRPRLQVGVQQSGGEIGPLRRRALGLDAIDGAEQMAV
jgi:hypothetical protein